VPASSDGSNTATPRAERYNSSTSASCISTTTLWLQWRSSRGAARVVVRHWGTGSEMLHGTRDYQRNETAQKKRTNWIAIQVRLLPLPVSRADHLHAITSRLQHQHDLPRTKVRARPFLIHQTATLPESLNKNA
jgi:hypothetical protein